MYLSLFHSDGTPNKTDKAALTKLLEEKQDVVLTDSTLPPIHVTVLDGDAFFMEPCSAIVNQPMELWLRICLLNYVPWLMNRST